MSNYLNRRESDRMTSPEILREQETGYRIIYGAIAGLFLLATVLGFVACQGFAS